VLQIISVYYWHFALFHHFFVYFFVASLSWLGYWWCVLPLFFVYCVHILRDDSPVTGSNFWPLSSGHWMVEYALRWFPMTLVRTAELDWHKQYIFGLHPHGMMPWIVLPIGKRSTVEPIISRNICKSRCGKCSIQDPFCKRGIALDRSSGCKSLQCKQCPQEWHFFGNNCWRKFGTTGIKTRYRCPNLKE